MKRHPFPTLILFFLLQFALAGSARAQFRLSDFGFLTDDPVGLDDCIKIALSGNPSHQKTKLNISLSSSTTRTAWGNFLPSVNAGYQLFEDDYFNSTYLSPEGNARSLPETISVPGDTALTWIDQNSDGTLQPDEIEARIIPPTTFEQPIAEGTRIFSGGQISLTQTLFAGGRNIFNLRSARSAQRASELAFDRDTQLLTFNISQAYFDVLAKQQLLELAERVLDQRREQLRLAKARYDVGSVTKLDVMQAEIDLGNQENELLQNQQELQIARMELNRLMGLSLEESYAVIEDSILFDPVFDDERLVRSALDNRPDMKQLESELSSYENSVWAERGSYLPTITFDFDHFVSEQGGEADSWTLSPRNRDTRWGFSLSWDIFSGFSREHLIKQAQVSAQNLRYDIFETKLSIEKEVKEASLSLRRIYRQSLITRKNRELARENLSLERERYRLGSASLLDLRSAQVTYIQAETDHISKLLEFRTTLAQLEYATGQQMSDRAFGGTL